MTVPTQESSESQASSCSVIIIASSVPSDAKRSARTAAAKLSPLPRAESFTCSSEETYFSPAEDLSAGKLIRKSANLESSTAAQSAAFEASAKSAALTFYFRNGECRQRSFSARRSYRRRTPRSRSCFRAKIIRLFRTRCRRKQGRHKVPAL